MDTKKNTPEIIGGKVMRYVNREGRRGKALNVFEGKNVRSRKEPETYIEGHSIIRAMKGMDAFGLRILEKVMGAEHDNRGKLKRRKLW